MAKSDRPLSGAEDGNDERDRTSELPATEDAPRVEARPVEETDEEEPDYIKLQNEVLNEKERR